MTIFQQFPVSSLPLHLPSTYLLPGVDHIDPEGVHGIPPDVIPVDPGDEHLALVVVAEEPADHDESRAPCAESWCQSQGSTASDTPPVDG